MGRPYTQGQRENEEAKISQEAYMHLTQGSPSPCPQPPCKQNKTKLYPHFAEKQDRSLLIAQGHTADNIWTHPQTHLTLQSKLAAASSCVIPDSFRASGTKYPQRLTTATQPRATETPTLTPPAWLSTGQQRVRAEGGSPMSAHRGHRSLQPRSVQGAHGFCKSQTPQLTSPTSQVRERERA